MRCKEYIPIRDMRFHLFFSRSSQSNHHGSKTNSGTRKAPETQRSTDKRNSASVSPASKKIDSGNDMKRFQKSAAIYTLPIRQNKRPEKQKGKQNWSWDLNERKLVCTKRIVDCVFDKKLLHFVYVARSTATTA